MNISFRCGNKFDLKSKIQVTDADMEGFCEQCRNLVSGIYKTSCKTGEGVEEMFQDIAKQLANCNKYNPNYLYFLSESNLIFPDLEWNSKP